MPQYYFSVKLIAKKGKWKSANEKLKIRNTFNPRCGRRPTFLTRILRLPNKLLKYDVFFENVCAQGFGQPSYQVTIDWTYLSAEKECENIFTNKEK